MVEVQMTEDNVGDVAGADGTFVKTCRNLFTGFEVGREPRCSIRTDPLNRVLQAGVHTGVEEHEPITMFDQPRRHWKQHSAVAAIEDRSLRHDAANFEPDDSHELDPMR